MGKKDFFENFRKEAGIALSKAFDKVREVSRTSGLKLKISNLRSRIKEQKTAIGEFVLTNSKEFTDFKEIQKIVKKIDEIDQKIESIKEELEEYKEKEDGGKE